MTLDESGLREHCPTVNAVVRHTLVRYFGVAHCIPEQTNIQRPFEVGRSPRLVVLSAVAMGNASANGDVAV